MKGLKLISVEKFCQVSGYAKGRLAREVKGRLLVLRHGYEMKALK